MGSIFCFSENEKRDEKSSFSSEREYVVLTRTRPRVGFDHVESQIGFRVSCDGLIVTTIKSMFPRNQSSNTPDGPESGREFQSQKGRPVVTQTFTVYPDSLTLSPEY